MQIDLSLKANRVALAAQILADIDKWAQTTFDDGPRSHLGASLIGEACKRKLWSVFRWLKHEEFTGRMQRLFQTGHREEARFIEYLRGIGFTVSEFDENGNQFKISNCNGHFGGSMDGMATPPAHYNLPPMIFVTEYKTKGTGAGFAKLKANGVKAEAPKHFAQMCQYGFAKGCKYGLYICKNKNDDDLYIEIVELSETQAVNDLAKAELVINSQTPPAKIAETPTYFECKFCNYSPICFENEKPELNCRSCVNATPVENAEWHCRHWNAIIPKDALKAGCGEWVSIV